MFGIADFVIVSMVLGAVLGLSLYLPLLAGQLSLASPGFYALGGYVAAVLSTRTFDTEGPYPVALVGVELAVAALLCGLLALVVGLTALRLSGVYLALATIAFVQIGSVVALNLDGLTGGAAGIFQIPQPFDSEIGYLWLALPLLVASALFTWRLEGIRAGRAFVAVREDELAAASAGVDTTRAKLTAFVLGGVMAGLAGVVAAHLLNVWNPRQGTFDASIAYLAFVLVGGSRTFLGPVAGGMFLTYLPEWLRGRAQSPGGQGGAGGGGGLLPQWASNFVSGGSGRFIIYGVLLAASCVFFPRGLITPELLDRVKRIGRGRRGRASPEPAREAV